MSYETAEQLDNAADYIEQHGWTQGEIRDRKTGAVCVMGGLREASDVPANQCLPLGLLDALRASPVIKAPVMVGEWRASDIVYWNDAPGRTQQEVLDALRLAAKQERIAEDGAL